jgi:hypothetical protein
MSSDDRRPGAEAGCAVEAKATQDPTRLDQTPARPGAETELRMARRHVREGEACIARQVRVIAKLREKGLPTGQAEGVLRWLKETQRLFEEHTRNLMSGAERVEPKNIKAAPFVDW